MTQVQMGTKTMCKMYRKSSGLSREGLKEYPTLILTEDRECVGVYVEILGPLHHTFECGHQTLQALDSKETFIVRGGTKLSRLSSLCQFAEVIHQPVTSSM